MALTTASTSEQASSLSAKYWIGPYAIAVSTLYLWGYWGSFHLNVLEYIGITEVVKAAVYPIASVFAFYVIGTVLGEVTAPTLHLPPGGGANTKVGKLLRAIAPWAVTIYLTGATLYFLFGPIEKWQVLPVLFAIAAYLPLKSTRVLAVELKSDAARSMAVFLLALLVPFAYGRGTLEAHAVLSGKRYTYTTSELPNPPKADRTKPNERPRYLGKIGDRYVFFHPAGEEVSLVAASEMKSLVLKQYVEVAATPRSESPTPTSATVASAPLPGFASGPTQGSKGLGAESKSASRP